MNKMAESKNDIFSEWKGRLPGTILADAKREITKRELNEKQTVKILERLKDIYDNAKIDSGESIGIVTAESFGEPGTQMTLNVFHFAGVAEVSVSQGLPRIIELFDARKAIKTPMMEVYLHPEFNQDPVKVRKIAMRIKEIKLEEYATEFVLNLAKMQVEINLDTKKLRDVGLKVSDLVAKINEELKAAKIKESGDDRIIIKAQTEENELIELYKLKEKVKDVYISGIKGVKQVLPVKSKEEFMILTAGTNLKEIVQMKEVDDSRITSNDMFEIAEVFGIEAARMAIINEARKIFQDQGLDVDERHFMLIADIITASGRIKGITRSGITGEKESVLARASFETPIKHIVNASLMGENDKLNSVVENVMLNQPVPLGTGLPDLVTKIK